MIPLLDWVFVQLRSKDDYRTVIATRSGLLQQDGDVGKTLDGVSHWVCGPDGGYGFYVASCHKVIWVLCQDLLQETNW